MRAGRGKLSGGCENLQGTVLFFLKFSTSRDYWLIYAVCYVLLFILVGGFSHNYSLTREPVSERK